MRTAEEILAYAIRQYKSARNLYTMAEQNSTPKAVYYGQLIPLAHLIRYAQGDHDGDAPIDVLNIPLLPPDSEEVVVLPQNRLVKESDRVAGVGVKKAMGIKG